MSPTRTPRPPRRAPARPAERDAYHHGALRAALIEATDALLAERGPEGFSLREVARRSGVSPAAPAHHFGDSEGLLVAVATLGFEGLTAALEAGNSRGGNDPVARLREQGVGYVEFALRHPGRFGLMFRGALRQDEALAHAAYGAFRLLEDGVRDLLHVPAGAPLADGQRQTVLAIWSTVHGFAHLALAGKFERALGGISRAALVGQVLPGLLQQQIAALAPRAPASTTPRAAAAPTRARPATSGSR